VVLGSSSVPAFQGYVEPHHTHQIIHHVFNLAATSMPLSRIFLSQP
jgi:hypothetical protein